VPEVNRVWRLRKRPVGDLTDDARAALTGSIGMLSVSLLMTRSHLVLTSANMQNRPSWALLSNYAVSAWEQQHRRKKMNTKKLFYASFVFAVGTLLCGGALADNCNGRYTNVNQFAETIDLGEGHTLTIFADKGSSTSENSDHTGVGLCGGYALTTPDGQTRVGYACAREGANGDSWSDYGGIEPGADRGKWIQVGGTGALAGKKNTGWFQWVAGDGSLNTGKWGGTCQ
jgi:hypothetical protein